MSRFRGGFELRFGLVRIQCGWNWAVPRHTHISLYSTASSPTRSGICLQLSVCVGQSSTSCNALQHTALHAPSDHRSSTIKHPCKFVQLWCYSNRVALPFQLRSKPGHSAALWNNDICESSVPMLTNKTHLRLKHSLVNRDSATSDVSSQSLSYICHRAALYI